MLIGRNKDVRTCFGQSGEFFHGLRKFIREGDERSGGSSIDKQVLSDALDHLCGFINLYDTNRNSLSQQAFLRESNSVGR